MARVDIETVNDCFGSPLRVGDRVVYFTSGDWDATLIKGEVIRITQGTDSEYAYDRDRLTISIRHANGVSPMRKPSKIMKLQNSEDGVEVG